jgi:hypothetical protein
MTDSDALRREFDRLADDELVSILQEWDEEQWRPEVFDIVASILDVRGVSWCEIDEPDAEGEDMTEAMNLVTVAEYISPLEANADRLALEAGGLKAWVSGGIDGSIEGRDFSARLQVRPGDLSAAMEILGSDPAPSSVFPPELAEPQCPRCGSTEVTEVEEVLDVLDASSALLSSTQCQMWLYRCAACKHEWSG